MVLQEVEGAFPELVSRSSEGLRSLQYSAFVPLLVEGMKDLRAQGDLLSSRLEQLAAAQSNEEKRRVISVKGLTASGAVTAHNDLAHLNGESLHQDSRIDARESREEAAAAAVVAVVAVAESGQDSDPGVDVASELSALKRVVTDLQRQNEEQRRAIAELQDAVAFLRARN